jgi:hypothetical protein
MFPAVTAQLGTKVVHGDKKDIHFAGAALMSVEGILPSNRGQDARDTCSSTCRHTKKVTTAQSIAHGDISLLLFL